MGNIFHVTQRNCLCWKAGFPYFFFFSSFSPSFPGSGKLVPCKLPVLLLLASRAGVSGKRGGRTCHGMQSAPAPQGWWAILSCDGGFCDSLVPQKPSSLSWQFRSSKQSLKALTKSLFNPWLTPFPSLASLCLKDLLCPSVFFYSGGSSSAAIPWRVFYFLSGQSSAQ